MTAAERKALVTAHPKLRPYADHLAITGRRGNEAVGVSPHSTSEKRDTFHVNLQSGAWHCKVSGEGGTLADFLEDRQRAYQQALTPALRADLASERGLPLDALPDTLGYDEQRLAYTLLSRDAAGRPCDIRRFGFVTERASKRQWYGTAGCTTGLYNVEALLRAADTPTPVYVCEGEWDAVALTHRLATARQKGVVVAVPGAGTFKRAWATLFAGHDVRLVFDHDEAGETGMARTAAMLASVAKRLRCLTWPADTADGYDVRDYCTDTAEDDARESVAVLRSWLVPFQGATVPQTDASDGALIVALLRDYVYSVGTKQFVRLADGFTYDKEQFNDLYGAHFAVTGRNSASSLLLASSSLVRVQQPAYVPGVEDRITNEVIKGTAVRVVNLWIPSSVVPQAGDVSPFLDHASFLFPEERDRRVCLDFTASVVRNPAEKHNWAVMLCGKPGIGKDLFVWPMVQTLGPHNCATPTPDDLGSGYTDWLQNARLVVVDTLRFTGQRAQLARMQQWIAAPPDYLRINTKFVPQFAIRNRVAFVFMANRDDALPLDWDDRRFYVYASPVERQPARYYRALWDWVRDNTSALAHYLLHEHEIASSFDAKTPPPMTEAKRAMIRANESPLVQLLRQALDEVAAPLRYELVTVREVQRHCEGGPLRGVTEHAVGAALRAIGATKLSRQLSLSPDDARRHGGSRPHVWAVANAETYQSMGRAALTEAFLGQRAKKTYRRPPPRLRVVGKEGA